MTFDTYSIYCAHQLARGQPAPTREWWDWAIAQARCTPKQTTDFDIETEQREGWAYGNPL